MYTTQAKLLSQLVKPEVMRCCARVYWPWYRNAALHEMMNVTVGERPWHMKRPHATENKLTSRQLDLKHALVQSHKVTENTFAFPRSKTRKNSPLSAFLPLPSPGLYKVLIATLACSGQQQPPSMTNSSDPCDDVRSPKPASALRTLLKLPACLCLW